MKKIQCDDLTAFIDAYIDDEFDVRDRADFEAHLAYCEACREEVDYQLAFKQQFKQAMQATQERTPEHLKGNILSMLQQTSMQQRIEEKKQARKRFVKRASAAALPAAAAQVEKASWRDVRDHWGGAKRGWNHFKKSGRHRQ